MPSLKHLRIRINSVKSTQKITSAMKMVAAAKLRRAQERAVAARPYAMRMRRILGSLAESVRGLPGAPPLLAGTGRDDVHLLVVFTSDRGLCGAFNSQIVRAVRRRIGELAGKGREVRLICVGRKGRDQLRRTHGDLIVETFQGLGTREGAQFADAEAIALGVRRLLDAGEIDVCTLFYNRFVSVLSQPPSEFQVIPLPPGEAPGRTAAEGPQALYEYEPGEEEVIAELLPRNLVAQIFQVLMESAAGEQGARMTAMDSATRNAGEMIDALTLQFNRTRQANITKELIEIISGAEAL